MDVSFLRDVVDLVSGGIWISIRDVIENSIVEQNGVLHGLQGGPIKVLNLRNNPNCPSKAVKGHFFNVLPIHSDIARLGVIEPV
jgi:hypothetical protein